MIKEVIDLLNYHEHKWILCVDLKMVSVLLGQQRGFTNYPCHLCMRAAEIERNPGLVYP